MGGEKFEALPLEIRNKGSPPHGRGKWFSMMRTSTFTMDHPRVGGEKFSPRWKMANRPGSLPRGRGKVPGYLRPRLSVGITPAWAGKRTRSWRAYGCPWDHPRVGGEKWFIALLFEPCEGSPPAWAGKRQPPARHTLCGWDHPRMGGEKCRLLAVVACPAGSPPRGRGKA